MSYRDYIDGHGPNYKTPDRIGYAGIRVLQQLVGREMDDFAMAIIHSLRPSRIRIIRHNGEEKTDARLWRVTVRLDADGRIEEIEQEVEVALVPGWRFGADAMAWLKDSTP